MTSLLRTLLGFLALLTFSGGAQAAWKDVAEITLTLPKGTSQAAQGHSVRVTMLKDGTAVKRDFTDGKVFNGNLPKGLFEALAKAVDKTDGFGPAPEGEVPNPIKEAVIVTGEERKKFRLPSTQKAPALDLIETAIDKITWTKI